MGAPDNGGPHFIVLLKLLALRHGQLVAAVIVGIFRMALDPVQVNGVLLAQVQQPSPQIRVEGGLFVTLHPAPGPPALGLALAQAVNDVL